MKERESSRNKGYIAGNVLIVTGLILVLSSAALLLYNRFESSAYIKRGEIHTDKVRSAIMEEVEATNEDVSPKDKAGMLALSSPSFRTVEIDGSLYDGYLQIPSIELETAVLDTCDEDSLKAASCRYYGSPLTDDLIIAGHNYAGSFGKLRDLTAGDSVYFTDMDGNTTEYTVKDIEVVGGNEVSRMLSGEWDLTLYTCTYGGRDRLTVRCDRAD